MSTPAGWYDDGQGNQRWWDGAQWTAHIAPKPEAPAVPAPVVVAPVEPAPVVAEVPVAPEPVAVEPLSVEPAPVEPAAPEPVAVAAPAEPFAVPAPVPAPPAPTEIAMPDFAAAPTPGGYGIAESAPAYAAPVAVAAPAKKSNKGLVGLFIGLAVVALLVIVGALLAVLFLFKGDKGGASTPEAAVEGVFAAIADKDCEAAAKFIYDSTDQDVKDCQTSLDEQDTSEAFDVKVTGADVDGNNATVHTTITVEGMEFPLDVPTIKKDGRWYIDDESDLFGDESGGGDVDGDGDTGGDTDADGDGGSGDDGGTVNTAGIAYEPGAVDFTDPMNVTGAYVWSYWAINDCSIYFSTLDPNGYLVSGQTEEQYCSSWGEPWDPWDNAAVTVAEPVDNGDGTVSVTSWYNDGGSDWEETVILTEIDGRWLITDITY